ncbi:uncharacterized protein LOC132733212 isoform X3 [Ruditapes philippinarum]|uniref:uncharacterized protein LOC132733212 isoform X3 n=1 Tax=Ruditapes philippinarum TaxID=129788 RepID=UPI00295A95DC|nr:uncharacterized protein LOC132733212 isoform X3 [Ruditapes philippinarum]
MTDNAKIHPLSTPSEQSGVLQPPRTDNLYQENSKQGNAQQQPTAVVVTQPENADQAAARRPPNYLPCAILASCFCFLCGLYAIQDAVQRVLTAPPRIEASMGGLLPSPRKFWTCDRLKMSPGRS